MVVILTVLTSETYVDNKDFENPLKTFVKTLSNQ